MAETIKKISYTSGQLIVPHHPKIPFFPGDGIGEEVWQAARQAFDAAVAAAYGKNRTIEWIEVLAGQKALASGHALLPDETLDAIREYRVAIKGPTMTPVGGGHRSINVTLRQALDLYANVRPVRYFDGVVAPVVNPEALDVVIFRENTEDVYAGIEFAAESDDCQRVEQLLKDMNCNVRPGSGIGIKVISKHGTRRLIRAAIDYALDTGRRRVTMVHKGNIMKETEGAFRRWGYELAAEAFPNTAIAACDLPSQEVPFTPGKVVLDDVIADAMFQELLLRPSRYDVIAAPNLNGDYLSDACAAQVGGLGIAPGANIGDGMAVFEATHGTAPDIAGKGIANPCSMMLSGAMLLRHIGWHDAAARIDKSVAAVLKSGRMTTDLAAKREHIEVLGTDAFGAAVVEAINS